jgi:Acetyltransferase (GNAT) family
MVAKSFAPEVSTFRGEFGELATLMERSWGNNSSPPILYSEAFLRSAFDYPGTSFDLAPSVYGNSGLVGFVAGFPRSVHWDGKPAHLILNSFMTASTAVKGLGLGLQLWAALIERCRANGYDGTINFCVEGDEMNRMMPGLSHLLRLNTQRIFSVEFLVRLLRPAPNEPPRQVSEEDISLFMELAASLPSHLTLRRHWTRAEAEWQCRGRIGALTVSFRAGPRRGVLTGYITQVASTPPTTVVLLEDLLWGDLEPTERVELVERFVRAAAAQGARTASCPVLEYASLDPLMAGRFRRSKRVLHTYLTFWNGFQPRLVPAIYIDVL